MPTQAVWGPEAGPYTPSAERPDAASARSGAPSREGVADGVVRVVGRLLVSLPRSAWILADSLILALGIHLGYAWFVEQVLLEELHILYWPATGVFVAAMTIAGLVFGLYERETLLGRSRILARMLLTAGLACTLTYACIYVLMYTSLSRRVAGCAVGTYLVLGLAVRVMACWAVHRIKRGLLVVGNRDLFESIRASFREDALSDYRLVGYVDALAEGASHVPDEDRIDGTPGDLPLLCRCRHVDDIVISSRAARRPDLMSWVLPCLRMGCRVTNEEVYYERAAGRVLVDCITPNWFLFADFQSHCQERATLKRLADVVIAGVGMIVSLPLWPLIALCIKLDDGGPVFYSQNRVGQNGRVFRLYKFRTMIVNAENGESVWASRNDPRCTRLGRWLRRSRLDELPQLYNILVGDMAVVGPRPERPAIVLELTKTLPYYDLRHVVKPGLTGWAQISYRYGASLEDSRRKLQYDLYYLKHMSLELDVVILFRTVGTFLRGGC